MCRLHDLKRYSLRSWANRVGTIIHHPIKTGFLIQSEVGASEGIAASALTCVEIEVAVRCGALNAAIKRVVDVRELYFRRRVS